MEPAGLAVLAAAAFATSILSAIVGMAGGITLLSVMLLFLDPLVAIPVHGVVQLVSNGSRTWIQRRHAVWKIVGWQALLMLPFSFVGLLVAQRIPPDGGKLLIGLFVLAATWAPGLLWLGTHPERALPGRRFVMLGAVVGFLSPTFGATGPLIAPFFLNLGLARQAIIGTKAACQALGHLCKIAVFGVAGFLFAEWLVPLAVLSAMVIVGTWVGSRVLDRVSEVWFTRLYKGVLTAIAVRLVVWDGAAVVGLR